MRSTPALLLGLCAAMCGSPGRSSVSAPKSTPEVISLQQEGHRYYAVGNFEEARKAFEKAYELAVRRSDIRVAVASLTNIGNCDVNAFAYKRAMGRYLEAKHLAEEAQEHDLVLAARTNIAHLYGAMGDFKAMVSEGEDILQDRSPSATTRRPYILLHLGNATHRNGWHDKSDRYFQQSALEAAALGNTSLEAMALDHHGLAYIDRKKHDLAEPLFRKAFELRKNKAPGELALSNRSLGILYSRLNRPADALEHLNKAIESQKTQPQRTLIYELYAERASVEAALGNTSAALADFRTALDYTRRWRLEVLPSGMLPAHWEGSLQQLRSSFIRFTTALASDRRYASLAIESLVAAEEGRLVSLRASAGAKDVALPSEYHQKLRQMQNIEASLLASGSKEKESQKRIDRLAIELREIELKAGLGSVAVLPADPVALAETVIDRLHPDEAIFSFYADEPQSRLWEITRGRVRIYSLPGRAILASQVNQFRQDLLAGAPKHLITGQALYSMLFGQASEAAQKKRFWTVVLDDRLFELPLAGLPLPSGGKTDKYLIEKHTLRVVPSLLLNAEPLAARSQDFLGIGDPIYNTADSRFQKAGGSSSRNGTFQLPRLLGSGREVDACARTWTSLRVGEATTLKGADANMTGLAKALRKPLGIVHFATHFVRSRQDSNRTLLALGLDGGSRQPDLVGDQQIANLDAQIDLVVLSGCHSGGGATIQGAGLLGMTRAWLLGGASNVAASHWPTPDDTGEIFQRFYLHYSHALADRSPYPAADALRNAQVDMLHSATWRNLPSYWTAFFLLSKG